MVVVIERVAIFGFSQSAGDEVMHFDGGGAHLKLNSGWGGLHTVPKQTQDLVYFIQAEGWFSLLKVADETNTDTGTVS